MMSAVMHKGHGADSDRKPETLVSDISSSPIDLANRAKKVASFRPWD